MQILFNLSVSLAADSSPHRGASFPIHRSVGADAHIRPNVPPHGAMIRPAPSHMLIFKGIIYNKFISFPGIL